MTTLLFLIALTPVSLSETSVFLTDRDFDWTEVCGDAWFYAGTDAGDLLVELHAPGLALGAALGGDASPSFTLPTRDVRLTLYEGESLDAFVCDGRSPGEDATISARYRSLSGEVTFDVESAELSIGDEVELYASVGVFFDEVNLYDRVNDIRVEIESLTIEGTTHRDGGR